MSSSCDSLQGALQSILYRCHTLVHLTDLACCQSTCASHISNGLFWIHYVLTEPCWAHFIVQAHCEYFTVGEGNSSNPLKQVLNAIEEKVECVTYDRVSKIHFASSCVRISCSKLLSRSCINPAWRLLVTC